MQTQTQPKSKSWTPRPNREEYNAYMREYMREYARKNYVKSPKKADLVTDEVKKQIIEMRTNNESWSSISKTMEISIYLVKQVCNTTSASGDDGVSTQS